MIDEYVKIYDLKTSSDANNDAELSADLFLHHKENGNLDKCNELGTVLAKTFIDSGERQKNFPYYAQKMVLIAYILERELHRKIENSLLQKSVLGTFKRVLERENKDLFCDAQDSAAFTMYILQDDELGDIGISTSFAEFCGHENDPTLIETGTRLINYHCGLFGSMIIDSFQFMK